MVRKPKVNSPFQLGDRVLIKHTHGTKGQFSLCPVVCEIVDVHGSPFLKVKALPLEQQPDDEARRWWQCYRWPGDVHFSRLQIYSGGMTSRAKAGRPAKWSGPTRAIRVPKHLADHLLDIARQLDNPEPNNVQNPSGLPICKPKSDVATIAQGLTEGWITHKLPDYPLQMLTSESATGTYRLFLEPPRELPPQVEASIEEYCDRVFNSLTETERVYLLTRLVEERGVKVDA